MAFAIRTNHKIALSITAALSALTAGTPAMAAPPVLVFSNTAPAGGVKPVIGQPLSGRVRFGPGLSQIRLDGNDMLSMNGIGEVEIVGDDVRVLSGNVTVIAGRDGSASIQLANGQAIRVTGTGSAMGLSVKSNGSIAGRGLGGTVSFGNSSFAADQSFNIGPDGSARAAYANAQPPVLQAFRGSDTGFAGGRSPFTGQNPLLPPLDTDSQRALVLSVQAALSNPAGFGFQPDQQRFLASVLASVTAGRPIGELTPANYGTVLAALIAAQQQGAASDAALRQALLGFYTGTPSQLGGLSAAQQAAINAYLANVRAGLPVDFTTSSNVLSAYFASLSNGNPALQGLTLAQLQQLLQYLVQYGQIANLPATQQQLINTYVQFLNGGGTFGQPPIDGITLARALADVVRVRREGQAAAFLTLRDSSGLDDALTYLRRNGIPAGLTESERERVEAALAFFQGGGGVFETPGKAFANATLNTPFTTGQHAVGYFGLIDTRPQESSSASGEVTFNASGVPTAISSRLPVSSTDVRSAQFNSTLMEGRSGPGWMVGRFGATNISTTGSAIAIAAPFTGTLPTSGTATYSLLGYTTPQYADGRLVTSGVIDASMRITFSGLPVFDLAGTITATDPLATRTYAFGYGSNLITATNSDLCSATIICRLQTSFKIAGAGGGLVVGGYGIESSAQANGRVLGGAWVFGGTLPVMPPVGSASVLERLGVSSTLTTGNYVGGQVAYNFANTLAFGGSNIGFSSQGAPLRFFDGTVVNNSLIGGGSASGTDWILARYTGIKNNSYYATSFAMMAPMTVALPTSGRADFNLLSYTTPIDVTGGVITSATMTGRAAILFGSTPRWGIDAALNVTRQSGVSDSYQIGSAANFTNAFNVAQSGPNGVGISNQNVPVTGTGICTSGNCYAAFTLQQGGANGDLLGGGYRLLNLGTPNPTELLLGSVIFQKTASSGGGGTPTTPTPPPPPPPPPTTPTATAGGYSVASYAANSPFSFLTDAQVTTTADQRLESITASNSNVYSRGTAGDLDNSSIPGIIGWTRWAGGTTGGTTPQPQSATGGMPIVYGVQPTALPTSGTADFTKIGSTAVVGADGGQTGTLQSAQMRVNFATMRVGYQMAVDFRGNALTAQSSGGIAAPSLTLSSTGVFFDSTFWSGGVCGTAQCAGRVRGFLAGPKANHAGLAFFINGVGTTAYGVAALASGD